jgi:hypothetical protein
VGGADNHLGPDTEETAMSDELEFFDDADEQWEEIDDVVEEEVDPREVEEAVAALNALMQRLTSESIKNYLEAACEDIAGLVEWEEEEEQDDPPAEAA